jgi:hypothetical protein
VPNRILTMTFCLLLFISGLAMARDKPDPLAGTWNCNAHGSTQGDITFTLSLTQTKDLIDGSISSSSPIGATQISSGTIRHHIVEIHVDTPQGNYILMGKYKTGHISGTWSNDTEKGDWEADRQDAKRKRKRHL